MNKKERQNKFGVDFITKSQNEIMVIKNRRNVRPFLLGVSVMDIQNKSFLFYFK